MAFVQHIECPHCKKNFPLPKKRHLPGEKLYGRNVTLCGMEDREGKLTAACRAGEDPNCTTCIRKRDAEKMIGE